MQSDTGQTVQERGSLHAKISFDLFIYNYNINAPACCAAFLQVQSQIPPNLSTFFNLLKRST